MPLPVLLLPPDQANYAVEHGASFIATQLDGGASRFRADQLGAAFHLSVQWQCSKKNYNYLTAFFRTAINYGSNPFSIDLIIDSSDLQTYTAHFMPGTFKLDSQSGATYVVSATIEVNPVLAYSSGDAAIILTGPE